MANATRPIIAFLLGAVLVGVLAFTLWLVRGASPLQLAADPPMGETGARDVGSTAAARGVDSPGSVPASRAALSSNAPAGGVPAPTASTATLAALRLELRRPEGDEPAADVALHIEGSDGSDVTVRTDARGRVSLRCSEAHAAFHLEHVPEAAQGRAATPRDVHPEFLVLPVDALAEQTADGWHIVRLAALPVETEVLVVKPDGTPAAGALVLSSQGGGAIADAAGIARLRASTEWVRRGDLGAVLASENLISEPTRPQDGTARIVLRLQAAAEVRVQVLDATGAPAPGSVVSVAFEGEVPSMLDSSIADSSRVVVDAKGSATLRGLSARGWRVTARNPLCEPTHADGFVKTQRGATAELVLRLGPVTRTSACPVAGRVIDTTGRPVQDAQVWYRDRDDAWLCAISDVNGAFEASPWIGPAPREITLRGGIDSADDLLEPEEQVVAFGRRDLVMRQVVPPRTWRVSYVALDADSGEPISARLSAWRPLSGVWDRLCESGDPPGLLAARNTSRHPVRYRIEATGFQGVESVVPPGRHHHAVVELQRGTDIHVWVRDEELHPIPGVQIWIGRHVVSVTDDEGRAWVRSRLVAHRLVFTCTGYRTHSLDATGQSELNFSLQRLP